MMAVAPRPPTLFLMPSLKISQKGGTSGEYAQGVAPVDNVVSEDGEQRGLSSEQVLEQSYAKV